MAYVVAFNATHTKIFGDLHLANKGLGLTIPQRDLSLNVDRCRKEHINLHYRGSGVGFWKRTSIGTIHCIMRSCPYSHIEHLEPLRETHFKTRS